MISTLLTVSLILQIVLAVVLIVIVLLQSGKEAGLSSAIAGNSNSYMGKGKSATMDAKLASVTKWVAAAFIVLTVAVLIFLRLNNVDTPV